MSYAAMLKKMFISALLTLAMAIDMTAQEYFMPNHYGNTGYKAPWVWQARTNGLYLLAGIFNVGIEAQSDLGITWQLDYLGAWWNKRSSNHFYSCYGFQTEVRYYFDALENFAPYRGHHVGLYGQLMTYDFEFGGTGYQSARFGRTWGAGLCYGYTFPLSRKLSLDTSVGLGYFLSDYDIYKPGEDGTYYKTGKGTRHYFGPTRLEATLVYIINDINL